MNGITELAKLLKERENSDGYSPIFGTVIELPNTKIRISEKVIGDRRITIELPGSTMQDWYPSTER